MLSRYDHARQRSYSELCNRSSSRSCVMGHQFSYASDSCEDYWEDASVSIRSFHGADAPATAMAPSAACSLASKEGEGEREAPMAPASHQFRAQRDLNEYTACVKRRRSFPPPLALCSTLSIKEGGRFVLKEMDADRPQAFFLVQRGNGRLRLQLVLADENDDEEDDHQESCTAEVDMAEPEAHCEETNTISDRDFSASDINGSTTISGDDEGGLDVVSDRDGIRRESHDESLEAMEYSDASSPWPELVGMDSRMQKLGDDRPKRPDGHHHFTIDIAREASECGKGPGLAERDGFLAFPNEESNQESVRSGGGNEEEPLWKMDVSNQALASLSPWAAKQMCMHASPLVVNMMPSSIGLAMS